MAIRLSNHLNPGSVRILTSNWLDLQQVLKTLSGQRLSARWATTSLNRFHGISFTKPVAMLYNDAPSVNVNNLKVL